MTAIGTRWTGGCGSPESEGAEARIALDLRGEPGAGSGFDAELYVQWPATAAAAASRGLGLHPTIGLVPASSTSSSGALWGTRQPLSFGGRLALTGLQVLGSGSGDRPAASWSLDRLNADLDWRQLEAGWRLDVSRFHLSRRQREWPERRFSLQLSPGHHGRDPGSGRFRLPVAG